MWCMVPPDVMVVSAGPLAGARRRARAPATAGAMGRRQRGASARRRVAAPTHSAKAPTLTAHSHSHSAQAQRTTIIAVIVMEIGATIPRVPPPSTFAPRSHPLPASRTPIPLLPPLENYILTHAYRSTSLCHPTRNAQLLFCSTYAQDEEGESFHLPEEAPCRVCIHIP